MDLVSLILLTAVAFLPLLLNSGPINTRAGGDSPFLLVRVQQLVTALRAGVFPVRWMPDAAYGLGYPFFNYYAPLPFYVAALFHLFGLGFIGAIKAAQVLGFLTAAVGMFLLTRQVLGSRSSALLASLAYTYAPFHLINVYVRGDSLGEFYAFALYPLIFLALHRLRARPSFNYVAFLALTYGCLVLSHNISALVFSPFILAHSLFLAVSRNRSEDPVVTTSIVSQLARAVTAVRWMVWPLAGLALGVSLSAWYWGPALMERGLVQLEQNLTGYFHYAGHFRRLDLVQPALLFDYSITGQRTPFAMGLLQTLFTLVAVLAIATHLVRQKRGAQPACQTRLAYHVPNSLGLSRAKLVWPTTRQTRLAYHVPNSFGLLLFTVYCLLTTVLIMPLSQPIWDHLPLLPFVQFPWRFLSVQSFFGSLLIGYLVTLPQQRRWRRVGAYVLALLLLLSAMAGLRVEHLPITDADVTPERLALYELFTANIGSTVRAEYLPQGVEPRPYTSAVLLNDARKPPPLAVVGEIEQAHLLSQSPAEQRWGITISSPEAELAFFTLYFPGWRAYVDGRRVPIGATKGSGFISIRVPQGQHEVVLRFWLTRRRAAAEGVSMLGLLILLGAAAWRSRMFRRFVNPMTVIGPMIVIGGNRRHVSNVLPSGAVTRSQQVSGDSRAFQRSAFWQRSRGEAKTLIALAAIAFFLSAAVLWLHARMTPPASSPLTMDFARMPYLHANPGGVRFGDDLRLMAYDYPDRAQTGETMATTLRWEGYELAGSRLQSGLEVEVALVSLAFHLFGVPDVLVSQTKPLNAVTIHQLDIPTNVMPGPYLILVKVRDEDGEVVPLTEAGESLGATYLRPLTLDVPAPLGPRVVSEPESVRGHFGPAIRLAELSYEQTIPQWLRVDLTWWTGSGISANYKTSVRLKDEAGQTLAQVDRQPLYGFYPTTAWRPGQAVSDRRWLSLPPDLPPGDDYRIEVVLYEVPSLQALGTAEIGGVVLR